MLTIHRMAPEDGSNLFIPSKGHVDPKAAQKTLKTILSLEEVKKFMKQKSDVQGTFFPLFENQILVALQQKKNREI